MKQDRTPTTQHFGLVNPEVTAEETPAGPPVEVRPRAFRTHIAEPHWQRVVSVIFVILAALIWWSFVLHWL